MVLKAHIYSHLAEQDTLMALLGGNEVTDPFMVTVLYIKRDGTCKPGVVTLTRVMGFSDNVSGKYVNVMLGNLMN